MSSPVDISPNHLNTVLDILDRHLPTGVKVWVFGSRADWTTKDSSDLDLALEGGSALDHDTMSALEAAFEESSLPYRVDVIDLNQTSSNFIRIIESHRTPLPMRRDGDVQHARSSVSSVDEAAGSKIVLATTLLPKWRQMPFSEAGLVNPPVRLERGKTYHFVDMAAMNADRQCVHPSGQREFRGGGSRFQDGDTIMACMAPPLENGKISRYRAADAMSEAHGPAGFTVVRGRPGVTDNDFVYYLSSWNEVRRYVTTPMAGISGRQKVTADSLDRLHVPVPPLAEQQTITRILKTLDDKIELNRHMNQTLEGMARALFRSWFVDFDPVRAKMDGRWPPGTSLPGLPAHLYDIFPDMMMNSGKHEIPKGWTIEPLDGIVELHDSARMPLSSQQRARRHGPYPYYGAASIMDHVDDFLFQDVYVLVGGDGSVADAGGRPVLQYVWGRFWVGNQAHVIKGRNGISEEYLYLILQHQNIRPFVTGTAHPKLSQKNLKSIPVVLPDQPARRAFSGLIQPLFASLRNATKESSVIAAQRNLLLPKLMSGEIRAGS